MKNTIITTIALLASWYSYSQVGIGTNTIDTKAMLDVTSTTKGLLPPRMTSAERDAIVSPATGLVLFNTTTNSLEIKNSTAWSSMVAINPTAAGDMFYWNGTAWTRVPAGTNGQTLTFISNVPVWTGFLPANTVVSNGKIWMDRNLGATQVANAYNDSSSYGDLYQWGRGTDGHQIRTSSTTSTLSATDTPGNANFILTTVAPKDWRSTQNDNLWQGVYGINNPCPAGFRLPTAAECESERSTWAPQNRVGAFSSPLKLPSAGMRLENGSILEAGVTGFYWTSTIEGTQSKRLYFELNVPNLGLYSNDRSRACSVRCIKD